MKPSAFLALLMLVSASGIAGEVNYPQLPPIENNSTVKKAIPITVTLNVPEGRTGQLFRYDGTLLMTLEKGSHTVELPGSGYYEFTIGDKPEDRSGFYVAPQVAMETTDDPYFCVDAALSWLYRGKRMEQREMLVEDMKRNHIAAVRERFNWNDTRNPDQKTYNLSDDPYFRYQELRDFYYKNQLPVVEICHDIPRGYESNQKQEASSDIRTFGDDFQELAKHWSKYWAGWETWNEPDLNALPDVYVPIAKAQIYRSQAVPEVDMTGVITCVAYADTYHDYLAKNDLLKHLSVVSYHSYGEGLLLEDTVKSFRDWLSRYHEPNKRLWITESNRPYMQDATDAERNLELRKSAMNMVTTAVEGKACGLERFFPFVFADYREGPFGFGMIHPDGSPLHLGAAYFTTAKLLNHFEYIGDEPIPEGSALRKIRVFQNENGRIVKAYMTGDCINATELQRNWTGTVYDIDGRILASGSGTVIPIVSGVTFVETDEMPETLITDTLAMQLKKMAMQPAAPRDNGSGLILQARINLDEVFNRNKWAYIYDLTEMPETITVPLNFVNLADDSQKGILKWNCSNADTGVVLLSGEENFDVPANSQNSIELALPLQKLLEENARVDLTLDASPLDFATIAFERRKFDTYVAGMTPESSPFESFASQIHWRNMGALWQWQEDLDCAFQVVWQPDLMTITVDATDNIHHQPEKGAKIWMGDSYQFVMQPLPEDRKDSSDEKLEVALALNDGGSEECYLYDTLKAVPREVAVGAVSGQVSRNGTKMHYVVTIKPEALGMEQFKAGMEFGFSMILNEDDNFGRKGAMAWGDGISTFHGMTKTYNRLRLTDTP